MLTEREILQINLESHFLQLFVKLVDCPIHKQEARCIRGEKWQILCGRNNILYLHGLRELDSLEYPGYFIPSAK